MFLPRRKVVWSKKLKDAKSVKKHKLRKIESFCFWECGYIGFNIHDEDGKVCDCIDLPLKDAKDLLGQLRSAIEQYENLEKICDEHDQGITGKFGDE